MRTWISRLFVLGVLALVAIWGWHTCFPNPEAVICRRLTELAAAASYGPKDGAFTQLGNIGKVASLCAPDVRIRVSGSGYSYLVSGRDQVREAAAAARSSFASLSLKLPDLRVRLAPDKLSAVVDANVTGRAGDHDLQLVEVRFTMRKVDGEWLVAAVETTSTFQ